jgi:hypothetical protein
MRRSHRCRSMIVTALSPAVIPSVRPKVSMRVRYAQSQESGAELIAAIVRSAHWGQLASLLLSRDRVENR